MSIGASRAIPPAAGHGSLGHRFYGNLPGRCGKFWAVMSGKMPGRGFGNRRFARKPQLPQRS